MDKEQNANQWRKESSAFDKYDDSSLLSKHELHSEGGARLQPTLEELLAEVTDDNIHAEIDNGPPMGRELWD